MPHQSPADDRVGRMQFLLSLRRRGHHRRGGAARHGRGAARAFRRGELSCDTAYADQALPIACGQTISQPYVVAYMTEQLGRASRSIACSRSAPARAIRPRCCRGWRARWSASSATARWRKRRATGWRRLGYRNVDVRVGDGLAGVPERAPYDRIIVTAAAEAIPEALVDQLADGGVMVLPLGPHAGPQQLVKLTKGEGGITREDLIGVRFVPLLPGQAREL